MAQVYEAIQKPLDRKVAVKVLHPHLTEQQSFRDRFLREAKAVASLQHPNIVQVYDYEYLDDQTCYMAMEFLSGQSLEDRIEQMAEAAGEPQHLSLDEALQIVIEVAHALEFAHKQGVVHRDVKPGNVMQTEDGRIVLTDFGIATLLHETRVTVDGGTTGTPTYMSPEQALGDRGDERSDIYSLGAVLYQLVTGQLPFEADTMYGLIMMHINDPPPPASEANPELPKIVEDIICKAMAKEPEYRYNTANEFAADLQAILSGESISVDLPPDNQKAASWLTPFLQYKVSLGVGAVALLALLIFGLPLLLAPSTTNEASEADIDSMAAKPNEVESMTAKDVDEGLDSMAATTIRESVADDFGNNELGWLISDGSVSRQLVDGAYEISISEPNKAISAYPDERYIFDDFVYEAEATLMAGQPESGYGLIFRRKDNQNYYVFAVNGLRQWSVWRLQEGSWTELRNLPDAETWSISDAILPQGEMNTLRVEADGANLLLFVNDQSLTQTPIIDTTFNDGGFGIYMASSRTTDDALAQAIFDNVSMVPMRLVN